MKKFPTSPDLVSPVNTNKSINNEYGFYQKM